MATQGQRRAEGRKAVRTARTYYRKADSLGESLERELDRLIKRKTLITVDQLQTLFNRFNAYADQIRVLQKALNYLYETITAIPS